MPPSQPYAAQAPAYDPTAVMGTRVVAGIVDLLLYTLLAVFFVFATPLSPLAEYDDNPQDLSQEDACEILQDRQDATQCFLIGDKVYWTDGDDLPIQIGAWLVFMGGYVLLQGATGFSPGKLLVGLRVVREDGRIAGIGKSFVRTLLWVVDSLPCLFLVGFICALTSTGHRRVGDMAAKTFVVRKSDVGRPVTVPGMVTAASAPGMPGAYGTPTVYPSAPPYQPTAPGAPGAWGAPPSQPGAPGAPMGPTTGQQPVITGQQPVITGQQPAVTWGAPPPPVPPVAPPPGAPGAPGAPQPGPSDTARYDVPFGAGAPPSGPTGPTGVPADSPADVTLVSGGPQGADDPTVVGGPPAGDDRPPPPVIEAGQSPADVAAPESGEQPYAPATDAPADELSATEPPSGESPAAEAPGDELSPAEAPEAPSRWLATPTPSSSEPSGSPRSDDDTDPGDEADQPVATGTDADADTTADDRADDDQPAPGDDPHATGATEVISVGDLTSSDDEPPGDDAPAPDGTIAEPAPEPAEPTEPEPEPAATATSADTTPAAEAGSDEQAGQSSDSPYKPQWDAARGAYIQWDPNRSRWLQWDDAAKEWNAI